MRFEHPARRELGVRLGYGLNLHPTEDVSGVRAGCDTIATPLRARLAPAARAFGFGAWIPGVAARELAADPRLADALVDSWVEAGLDPFTFNAFPIGGFHARGLKQRVFEPTWMQPERVEFTLAVARLALRARLRRGGTRRGHLSISTHAGQFAATRAPGDRERCVVHLLGVARELARLEAESGERIVLSIEPEPRSSANDTRELAGLLAELRLAGARSGCEDAVARHLGACLDTCHAAVEFEAPAEALERATAAGTALGKLQFSSALSLRDPDGDARGRARFLALDEPVYLHQVTALRAQPSPGEETADARLARALDLDELRRRWEAGDPDWRGSREWRCHFHVPVDLGVLPREGGGLSTTRAEAGALLSAALARPELWGSSELHVEVETYTWNVLDPASVGTEERLAGLEREWRHVAALLASAGWHPVVEP